MADSRSPTFESQQFLQKFNIMDYGQVHTTPFYQRDGEHISPVLLYTSESQMIKERMTTFLIDCHGLKIVQYLDAFKNS